MKPKGKPKPKYPPSTRERARITSLAAAGASQRKIARTIGRSRDLVQNVLAEPEVQRSVEAERAELSRLCLEKGRSIIDSINHADITKAGLRDKAVAGAVMVDKSLMLAGDTPSIDVRVLLEVAHAIRDKDRRDQDRRRVALPLAPALPQPEDA